MFALVIQNCFVKTHLVKSRFLQPKQGNLFHSYNFTCAYTSSLQYTK
jgi:hypothetical protein